MNVYQRVKPGHGSYHQSLLGSWSNPRHPPCATGCRAAEEFLPEPSHVAWWDRGMGRWDWATQMMISPQEKRYDGIWWDLKSTRTGIWWGYWWRYTRWCPPTYPLVNIQNAIENGHWNSLIVDLPSYKNGDFPVRELLVYQSVGVSEWWLNESCKIWLHLMT